MSDQINNCSESQALAELLWSNKLLFQEPGNSGVAFKAFSWMAGLEVKSWNKLQEDDSELLQAEPCSFKACSGLCSDYLLFRG